MSSEVEEVRSAPTEVVLTGSMPTRVLNQVWFAKKKKANIQKKRGDEGRETLKTEPERSREGVQVEVIRAITAGGVNEARTFKINPQETEANKEGQ